MLTKYFRLCASEPIMKSSPQNTSFPGISPGMSLDSLSNIGMCIDNDIII